MLSRRGGCMRLSSSVRSRIPFLGVAALAYSAAGLAQTIQQGSITVKLGNVVPQMEGAGGPVDLEQPIGDSSNGNRLFVTMKTGQIRLIKNETLQATPFANIASI